LKGISNLLQPQATVKAMPVWGKPQALQQKKQVPIPFYVQQKT